MRRRDFLALTVVAAFPARAEQPAMPTIGYLGIEAAAAPHPEFDAFRAGLGALGYVEGRSITIAARLVAYREEALAEAAAELVARHVAVIVAFAPTIGAAMGATATIPIVIRTTDDPVRAGFARSLAHPGGNVTGVSSYSGSLYGKRLELARDLIPGLNRVAILFNDNSPTSAAYLSAARNAATALGLAVATLVVHRVEDFADAFDAAVAAGAGILLPLRDPVVVGGRVELARLAAAHRLPAIYDDRQFCEAGGLASYGADLAVLHRRAAYYVDRLLKGALPAELPIEEPKTFELVINLRVANALGLTIPPVLLARANEVIE